MASVNYVRIFTHAWRSFVTLILAGAILALAFSLLQPLRYSSSIRLLLLQTNAVGVDPYTAIKSTERIAENISVLIYTSSFFNAVMSKAQVDPSYFPQDETAKRKLWADTIQTDISGGTGIMTITAYHTDRNQATELAAKTAQQIVDLTPNYFGYSIRAQIIDDPLPSTFYTKPDFLKNSLIGALAGLLLAAILTLLKTKDL